MQLLKLQLMMVCIRNDRSFHYLFVVLFVAVSTNNVQLVVNRFGRVGTILVLWQAGTNQLVGVENGSIVPATGSIEMQPMDMTATIILTVRKPATFLSKINT